MKAKTVSTAVLLVFVAASVVYLVVSETRAPQSGDNGDETAAAPTVAQTPGEQQTAASAAPSGSQASDPANSRGAGAEHKVIAYYFHNTMRCVTCLTIESLAEEALREEFPDAFDRGELEWHLINMEEPANIHFAHDYQLVTSSLVLVDLRGGKQHQWIHMKEVWQLVDDEVAFKAYVADQARKYLESVS